MLIYWVVKQFAPAESSTTSAGKALEILKERYAKGEITREEYEQMKKDLLS